MPQFTLAVFLFFICLERSQAQSVDCYPRIGAYSGQYEGHCPGSDSLWIAVENTIGAYGRNCSGETWTYTRKDQTLQKRQTKEIAPMNDCAELSPAQIAGSANNLNSDEIRQFHEQPLQLQGLSLR
ncbi:hypothetical protein [Microvirga sp. P5_D2]